MPGNQIAYYTAEGGVVIKGNTRSKHGICVMPPAQGVRQRTGEGSGNITLSGLKKVDVEAKVDAKTEHDVTKLYEQTSATLFMQQGLYRVCEMAANGAFDKQAGTNNRGNPIYVVDTEAYQRAVNQIFNQSYDLVLAEGENARARQLEAVESILSGATPGDASEAKGILEGFMQTEERVKTAIEAIGRATTEDGLEGYLNDPEPAIRRAANKRLWRLEEEKWRKFRIEAEEKARVEAEGANKPE